MRTWKVLATALAMAASLVAGEPYREGCSLAEQGRLDEAIEMFYNEIRINPQSSEAWREIGVAHYNKGSLDKAESSLKQAIGIKPDARANLYLGLTYEKQGNLSKAIDAYRATLNLKPDRPVKKLVQAHLDALIEKRLRDEVASAITGEARVKADTIPENTVAVVSFDDTNLPPDLAPISKGLAEFTAGDLAKVKSLQVVDRLKIDAILNELKLGASQYADPAFAPRMGRLVGGRHVVTGSVVGLAQDQIRLDGAVVNTADQSAKTTDPAEGSLKTFFTVQKKFVLDVLDKLGITPTQAERDSIMKVPTESYLAFLAYSRGLDFRSRGMYSEAGAEFRRAAAADPQFDAAQSQLRAVPSAAPPAGVPPASQEQFEASVTEAGAGAAGEEVGSFQTNTLNTTGFIRDPRRSESLGNTPDSPGLITNGSIIIIRGSFDARP
jgi:tetratricopeptide (TPR) repeat protein